MKKEIKPIRYYISRQVSSIGQELQELISYTHINPPEADKIVNIFRHDYLW